MAGVGIIFIDTETGNTNPDTGALLEIGVLHWVEGDMVSVNDWKVKAEGREVTEKALKVNRIDPIAHEREAQPRAEVAAELMAWLLERRTEPKYPLRVGGHNVSFDLAFIRRLWDDPDALRGVVRSNTVDTAGLLTFLRHAGILPPGADLSLRNGLKACGVPFDEKRLHTALGDALNTSRLYTKLLEMVRR